MAVAIPKIPWFPDDTSAQYSSLKDTQTLHRKDQAVCFMINSAQGKEVVDSYW